jgi:gamma-glutamylcyclotransferase (GGCT)/AIG2-like uncharacterized protein YtfP
MTYYLAYGSNLNRDHMATRCPTAVAIGRTNLQGMRLVFRSVADIEPAKGYSVPVGVWKIGKADEERLDRYEGVKGGLYRKVYWPIRIEGKTHKALVYIMNRDGVMPPWDGYFETIRQGYKDFGIKAKPLFEALAHARKKPNYTDAMLAHHARRAPDPEPVEISEDQMVLI